MSLCHVEMGRGAFIWWILRMELVLVNLCVGQMVWFRLFISDLWQTKAKCTKDYTRVCPNIRSRQCVLSGILFKTTTHAWVMVKCACDYLPEVVDAVVHLDLEEVADIVGWWLVCARVRAACGPCWHGLCDVHHEQLLSAALSHDWSEVWSSYWRRENAWRLCSLRMKHTISNCTLLPTRRETAIEIPIVGLMVICNIGDLIQLMCIPLYIVMLI